jgi:hypothetical protein
MNATDNNITYKLIVGDSETLLEIEPRINQLCIKIGHSLLKEPKLNFLGQKQFIGSGIVQKKTIYRLDSPLKFSIY